MSRLFRLERTSSPTSSLLKGTQQKDGLTNRLILWCGVLLLKKASIPMTRCCGIYSLSTPHKDGNPLTNRTPTDKEQQLGWEYIKRLLDLHLELGGVEPLMLAVGQKSADTSG